MKSTFVKGLIMTLIALIATTLTTTGLPTTLPGLEVLAITVIGTVLTYLGKNWAYPSTSVLGNVNIGDMLSGGILALGTALSSWAASAITSTPVNWHSLISLCVSVVLGYLAKNFVSGTSIPTAPAA